MIRVPFERDDECIQVILPIGKQVRILFDNSDGEITVSFDYKEDRQILVHSDLPGSILPSQEEFEKNQGVIYVEDFGLISHPNLVSDEKVT